MVDIKNINSLLNILSSTGITPTNPEARTLQLLGAASNNVIAATVVSQDGKGSAILRFPQLGELLVQTKLPLLKGEEVLLRLINTSFSSHTPPEGVGANNPAFQVQARVIRVDGKPVSEAAVNTATQQSISASLATIILPTSNAKPSDSILLNTYSAPPSRSSQIIPNTEETGQFISARLVSLPGNGGEGSVPRAPLINVQSHTSEAVNKKSASVGDQIQIQILKVVAPSSQDFESSPATGYSSNLAARGYNAVQQTLALQTIQQSPISKSEPPLQSISSPNSLSALTSNAPELVQKGVVLSADSFGEYLLRTSFGVIKLPLSTNLPLNTEIDFIVSHIQTPDFIASSEEFSEGARTNLLSSFFNLVRSIDTEIGTNHSRIIPQLNVQFAARILWFLHHIDSNTQANWLGQGLRQVLKQGEHKELLQQLGRDAFVFRAASSENNLLWQGLAIPIFDGEQLHYAKLYKQRPSKKDQKEESRASRFVVDLEMDALGYVQLDAFFHQETHVKQLHIHIRSHEEFSDGMQRDIRNIFDMAQQSLNQSGSLEFSVTKEFPLLFTEVIGPENPNEIIA